MDLVTTPTDPGTLHYGYLQSSQEYGTSTFSPEEQGPFDPYVTAKRCGARYKLRGVRTYLRNVYHSLLY